MFSFNNAFLYRVSAEPDSGHTLGLIWHPINPGDPQTSDDVNGTNADDFIHRQGDGLHVPAHYHDIHETTTGSDYITAGKGDDIVYGDKGNDGLFGEDGNDVLYGGKDIDYYYGGNGNDTIHAASGEAESAHGGKGNDTIISGDDLFGEEGNDTLTDNTDFLGAYLDGGPGNDRLIGDGFTFALYVDAASDVTVDLRITTAQDTGDGTDRLTGISGVTGGDHNDTLTGDDGDNNMSGGSGNDTLTGNGGDDFLGGGDDSDVLIGGAGVDSMSGGFYGGSDRFVFKSADDSGVGAGHRDTIDQFFQSSDDKIDLSKIDADSTKHGDQAFDLNGHSFTHHAGQLIQFTQAGNTIIAGDTDGNGHANFEIEVTGTITFVDGDFRF